MPGFLPRISTGVSRQPSACARAPGSAGRSGWRVRARHLLDHPNTQEIAVSAREASAGYPPDAERGGRGEAEQARRARRRAKAKGGRAARCISNRSKEAAGVYGLEPAPPADGCHALVDLVPHATLFTKYFCVMTQSTSTGSTAITPSAETSPHRMPRSVLKNTTAVEIILTFVDVRNSA